MKILFCVSEAVPLAKTGGLADVGGALPAALAAVGCDVRVVLPRYRSISERGWRPVGTVDVSSGGEAVSGTILDGTMPETAVPTWLVDQPKYFDRSGLYGEAGRDYPDNLARFGFFCRAVLAWVGRQSWKPDLIHCNDWQTALIPPLIRAERAERTPTLLTIHNLAYQGLFPAQEFALTGLPASFFTMAGLEFWGQVNVLKGGLVFADTLTSVSETYAREIQTAEFGAGLDGVLRDRARDLWGILNGVDYRVWDPSHDPLIPAQYSAGDLTGKRICKEHLQREFGLYERPDIPIVGMVTRLVDQKGLDLVEAAVEDLFAFGVQLVVLGAGDARYEQVLGELPRRYPKRAGIRIGFDNALAHRIEAGADLFLMPSRYEPSGLNQLYSLRYGTVPVVRHTGGLADSIVDTTPDTLAAGTANGFVFVAYDAPAMLQALRRALEAFRTPHTWRRVQKTGMAADFSWTASARKYHALYDRTLAQSVRG
ncbi:MAG: starch synthase [Armatimonadetes bacterium 13_1_40CM_64_14]|nr:MAG: starch synthase [Armatimonadetes bacterium 13_1_40CM_64_14]